MKSILQPLMALCYHNGMLSPPSLAYWPPDLANNCAVPQHECRCGDSFLSLSLGGSDCFRLERRAWRAQHPPPPPSRASARPAQTPGARLSLGQFFSSFWEHPGPAWEVKYPDNCSCVKRSLSSSQHTMGSRKEKQNTL